MAKEDACAETQRVQEKLANVLPFPEWLNPRVREQLELDGLLLAAYRLGQQDGLEQCGDAPATEAPVAPAAPRGRWVNCTIDWKHNISEEEYVRVRDYCLSLPLVGAAIDLMPVYVPADRHRRDVIYGVLGYWVAATDTDLDAVRADLLAVLGATGHTGRLSLCWGDENGGWSPVPFPPPAEVAHGAP